MGSSVLLPLAIDKKRPLQLFCLELECTTHNKILINTIQSILEIKSYILSIPFIIYLYNVWAPWYNFYFYPIQFFKLIS